MDWTLVISIKFVSCYTKRENK